MQNISVTFSMAAAGFHTKPSMRKVGSTISSKIDKLTENYQLIVTENRGHVKSA